MIPDAAIEATAAALDGHLTQHPLDMDGVIFAHKCACEFLWEGESELRDHMARIAVEAATPAIEKDLREVIAQEILAEMERRGVGSYLRAARIVRGGTP